MIQLTEHPEGTLLAVRARAGGRVNGVTGIRQGELMVSVTQVAERGKANQAIVGVLSKLLGCGKRQIELVRGATSGSKQFLLVGIDAKTAAERIRAAVDNA
ncbi:DUF167 domain-containing protein [Aeoliella sp. ICT_H6.2]|uniref:UPF0235 protein NG895_11835 n=1 Tax=Aeoliella straminimaris TaxID=2954799 RepID=A0A9X2FAF9_9BACT|nr:DUF167 domain-containing protein [Aeoliella straminimaris]MCO6044598.1 DUF167 domain-containing protein [Aeoliella straminimaris]